MSLPPSSFPLPLPYWPSLSSFPGTRKFCLHPIACGGVLVMPGDIIIADDDGAVVVPLAVAPQLVERAGAHHEWEEFSRRRLSEGGDLRKYYPLNEEARAEYEAWKQRQK